MFVAHLAPSRWFAWLVSFLGLPFHLGGLRGGHLIRKLKRTAFDRLDWSGWLCKSFRAWKNGPACWRKWNECGYTMMSNLNWKRWKFGKQVLNDWMRLLSGLDRPKVGPTAKGCCKQGSCCYICLPVRAAVVSPSDVVIFLLLKRLAGVAVIVLLVPVSDRIMTPESNAVVSTLATVIPLETAVTILVRVSVFLDHRYILQLQIVFRT